MTLRSKILAWWSAIIIGHLLYWIFDLSIAGSIAGWLLLISRIWISFISKSIAWFAIALFVLSVALPTSAVLLLMRQEHPSVLLIHILAATGGGCSWMFLFTVAISDFISFRENTRIA